MSIHVYAACYNEELLLPYFLRHYGAFAERIVIFDDNSSDHSRDIILGHSRAECITGVPVYSDSSRNVSDSLLQQLKNEAYKSSRGSVDWVIIVDIDEFLFHPDLVALLKHYRSSGVTLPAVQGFEMVSSAPPGGRGQIYSEIGNGFRNDAYSKHVVFDPHLDIGYQPGAHTCNPAGNVRPSQEAELKLLHYRFLGEEYFVRRYLARSERLSPENVRRGWGTLLSVPGPAGRRSIHGLPADGLATLYRDILREQPIVEVI